LPEQWNARDLIWDLNSLYGGTFADEPFRGESGARTFAFWGERATEAHALCDGARDGWFRRSDTDETVILTMGEDNDSMRDFVESVLLIIPAAGYLEWTYSLFVVPDDKMFLMKTALRDFKKSMEQGRKEL
jgi:hypothetical protein